MGVSFPSLFVLASSKEAWAMDLWTQSSEGGVWSPIFSKHLNDWEIEGLKHSFARLKDKVVMGDKEGKVVF